MSDELYALHMQLQRLYYDYVDYMEGPEEIPVAAEIAFKIISAADDVLLEEYLKGVK